MNVFAAAGGFGRGLWIIAALAAALVAACGGGTSQAEPFKPRRFVVFGDENSVILGDTGANGRKYSVNGLDANQQRDCKLFPIWVQSVATHYGFAFAECNPDGVAPLAFMRAKVGATVGDAVSGIAAQLAEQAAAGEQLGKGDLLSVMLGANDLHELALSLAAGTMSHDDAIAEARRRGETLASAVNQLLSADTRILLSTVPDIATTPFGRGLEQLHPGLGARLTQLSYEFNARLRTTIDATRFDGRNYALVLSDDLLAGMTGSPGSYALSNVTDGVCVAPLPDCNNRSADLLPGASATAYMWADARRMASTPHAQIGAQAVSRVVNNPF